MKFLYRIIRHPVAYWTIVILLVLAAVSMTAWQANRRLEQDREIALIKVLGNYAATIDGGTVNSRAMGAAILFGLQNQKAKKLVLGKLPPDSPEVLSALETLRTLYFADSAFVVNKRGTILAYSDKDHLRGTGQDISFRPYVQLALQGTSNAYPAVGVVNTTRGIYLAAPLRAAESNISTPIGAVVVRVGAQKLDALLGTWTDGIAVLLSPQGIVFATTRSDWLLGITGEPSAKRMAGIQHSRQFGDTLVQAPPPSLPFTLAMHDVTLDGVRYAIRSIPLEMNDPAGDWMLTFMEKRPPWWANWSVLGAVAVVGLVTALALIWLYALALAQSRLRKSESRLHAILDNSPVGIWLVGVDGRYKFVNNTFCEAVGAPESRFLDTRNLAEILGPEAAANCIKSDRECLEWNEPHLSHELLTLVDGKQHLMEITKVKLHDDKDGVDGIIGISMDITERRQAEMKIRDAMRKLEEKELAKTRFLAAAGHDMRQPLAAANLFIDAFKNTELTPDQTLIVQRLDQAMSTFNGLLNALLNISKLDAGIVKPEYTSIRVTEIIDWLDQNFAQLAGEKNLRFRFHFPVKERLIVRSDIGLIKSILMNIVSNAIKFTSAGSILASARQRGDKVLFQVWDTGVGIKAEHLNRVFDEFYQVDNPQRDRAGGLGLGLSIAKRASTLLGIEITCRSQFGRGSVFSFSLPLDTTGEEAPKAARITFSHDSADDQFVRGKRLIVVEDDKLVARAMIDWLQGLQAEVSHFHSAEDALHHADVADDYYIVDYMLSGELNGIQYLNQLRERLGRPIKAVLVTGDTSPAFVRGAVLCDWPILHKPVNTSQLISSLSKQVH